MAKNNKDQLPEEFLERAMSPDSPPEYELEVESVEPTSDETKPTDGTTPASSERTKARPRTKKSTKSKSHSTREEQARKSFRQFISDDDGESPLTLRSILGGDMFGGRRFRRQMWYFLMVCVMAVIYVANRYACQKAEIRREELSAQLQDRKFKALTAAAELTEFSMRSNVEENLPDSTLHTSTRAAYNLPVVLPTDSTQNANN